MKGEQQTEKRPRVRWQADLHSRLDLLARVDGQLRKLARPAVGLFCRPPSDAEWIVCVFYHWVLDDQRTAFRRQLQWYRRHADFISMDDAVAALDSPSGIGGRYFCLTFDDGFKNWFTNAVPILSECQVPAAFFIPSMYIGLDLDADWGDISGFYTRSWSNFTRFFEFLSWEECRKMAALGFSFGSHTHSHPRLLGLPEAEVEREMTVSKQIIETQLGTPCRHFCCPWGKAGRDYDEAVHPELARRAGYRSFLTTDNGISRAGDSALRFARISSAPELGPLGMRYALFRTSHLRARQLRTAVAPELRPETQETPRGSF